VMMRQAYISFNIPETSVNAKIGTQTLTLGHSLVLDTELDSLLLTTSQDNLTASAVYAKGYEGDLNVHDDRDFYGLVLNLSPQEKTNLGFYAVYGQYGATSPNLLTDNQNVTLPSGLGNRFADTDAYWLGLTADFAYDQLSVAFELAYSDINYDYLDAAGVTDEGTGEYEQSGWAAYLNLDYKLQDNLNVGLDGIYVSGDDNSIAGETGPSYDDDRFVTIGHDFINATWEEDIVVEGNVGNAGLDSIYGVKGLRLYAMMTANEKLSLKGKIGYFWREEDPVGSGEGNEDTLGCEIDGFVYYNIYDNLKFKGFAEYLFANEDALGKDAEDVWRMGQKITYAF
ncbi:MAG: hypothetical protein V1872_00415, partial [bacterium]